jgi:hypothetical protein
MKLTQKLLGFFGRVFSKNPDAFLALRLRYNGGMSWAIADGMLTTVVSGGIGSNLSIDLTQYTVRQLVAFLAAQPGYSVAYAETGQLADLSARVLIDGGANIADSNGDHISGYTNLLWAFVDAGGGELEHAAAQIDQMLLQLDTHTASAEWLDELGGYYGVPRLQGEFDAQYAPRIIAEVLRPRDNNIAMELALQQYTGQPAQVVDVVEYGSGTGVFIYNSAYSYNGAKQYNSASQPIYGKFDVVYSYDLLGGTDPNAFAQTIRDLINRLRAAGTHLRAMSLQTSAIMDTVTPPTDGGDLQFAGALALGDTVATPGDSMSLLQAAMAALADTVAASTDTISLSITSGAVYGGNRSFNSAITYSNTGTPAAESF